MRPYLRRHFTTSAKAHIARCHYATLDARLNPGALAELRSSQGLVLSEFAGKSGRLFRFVLRAYPHCEGEVMLEFVDVARGIALAWLLGSVGPGDDGELVFWLGALQGPRPPHGLEEIAEATRELNGLRPKQAVLQALGIVCAILGAAAVYAPGNANHLSSTFERRVLGRAPKVHSDLDGFWQEFTGERTRRGDYRIALPLRRRSADAVPSKRRREWKLRYARVDMFSAQVAIRLSRGLLVPGWRPAADASADWIAADALAGRSLVPVPA